MKTMQRLALRRTLLSGVMGLTLLAPSLSAMPVSARVASPDPGAAPALPVEVPSDSTADFVVAGPNPQVPGGYEPVAETASLRLFINRDDSKLIVDDKRSGKIWTSNPLQPLSDQKTILDDAVFQLNYTNARRQMTNLASSASEKPKLGFQNIPGGVRVNYELEKLKIKLTVDYAIKEEARADIAGNIAYLEV